MSQRSRAAELPSREDHSWLLAPAILATVIGLPLLGLSVLLHVVGEVAIHTHPAWLPRGTTYVGPSPSQRVWMLLRAGVPVAAGLCFLVLTWRFLGQKRPLATCCCALAVVMMGVAAFW